MIKSGPLTNEELAEQGYLAWQLGLAPTQYAVEEWQKQSENLRRAWEQACGEFYREGMRGRLNGWTWQQAAAALYGRVAAYGGLIGDVLPYDEMPWQYHLAAECVARHLVNVSQADDGEDLVTVLASLLDKIPDLETKLSPILS